MNIQPRSNMPKATPRRQAGAVLVVALLFLMIITMLGVASLQSTSSEERMAGNARDSNTALMAAEAALRDAWYDINGACAPGAASCTKRTPPISGSTNFGDGTAAPGTCSSRGLCLPNGTFPNYTLLNITNWSSSGAGAVNPVAFGSYTSAGTAAERIPQVATQPQYIIEALCMPSSGASVGSGGGGCPNYVYRITARGFGGNSNTQVTLQMIVRL
jgi:type IV pilus assembly protein PilX